MRPALMLLAAAFLPTIAAAAPLCAIPGASPPPRGAPYSAPIAQTSLPAPKSAVTNAPRRSEPVKSPAQDIPAIVAGLPFVKHIAASGARLSDLGLSHGMHGLFARSGDQFMIFQITPDGAAAVAGAVTDLSPTELDTFAAGNVRDLGVEHGLRTLFVRSGSQFQVFYVTPDGERVIPGVMWDANGKDLTRAQVASVPGAVPTVVVGSDHADPGTVTKTTSVAALPLLQTAAAGSVGSASAPHVWMLIDPQCVYSIRAFQMLQPYVASRRLRISVVPLAVLDYEDHDASTKAALALLSLPADRIVTSWQARDLNGPALPAATTRLRTNMAIAEAIHLTGTPTFIWRKADGSEGRLNGLPTNPNALVASVGN
jgi:thiol:disulfide interchange protein DsbG